MQGITLAVAAGQIVGMLGTNGAGKTTMLRAISGFLGIDDARVTDGTIRFKGARIENGQPHQIARLGIALVPERDKVFPNLTVAENLLVPARATASRAPSAGGARRRSISSSPARRAARAASAGLLSGGERQMLAHRRRAGVPARAAAGRRAVARPGAGRGRGPDARACSRSAASFGITILLVEQSAAVALEIADHGYVMENGRIVLDGDAARLREPPRHPGVLPRPVARRRAPQLSRRQAVPPQPEVVWLSSRSRTLSLRFGGLTVLDDVSLRRRSRRAVRADRPQRRRQDQRAQLHQRHLPRRGPHPLPRPATSPACRRARSPGSASPAPSSTCELFPHMSVLDNIMVGRHARISHQPAGARCCFFPAVRREEVRHREAVERIIEFVELEGVRHAQAGALPFGIQKIVGLARALALEPALLLLDEPSAGLNRDEREDLARFILRIKHELRLPMIWIEHDMQMVADLADRIHVLNYGRTLAAGAPAQVLSDPAVIAAYLGTSATVLS